MRCSDDPSHTRVGRTMTGKATFQMLISPSGSDINKTLISPKGIGLALAIGTQLGSMEVTALIGRGGMGEVYRARDTKLKRDVAIKILPDEFSRDADRVSRFQREAEVLASTTPTSHKSTDSKNPTTRAALSWSWWEEKRFRSD
jgi:serine/threonine protein kinase